MPYPFIPPTGVSLIGFSDDFNRANNDDPGNSWDEVVGDFDILSNTLNRPGTGGGASDRCLRPVSQNWTDGFAQIALASGSGLLMGVAARFDGANNSGYYTYVSDPNLQLVEVSSGSKTTIGSFSVGTPSAGDTVKVECTGSTIKAYHNGTERISVSDSTHAGPGRAGLFCPVASLSQAGDDFTMEGTP